MYVRVYHSIVFLCIVCMLLIHVHVCMVYYTTNISYIKFCIWVLIFNPFSEIIYHVLFICLHESYDKCIVNVLPW